MNKQEILYKVFMSDGVYIPLSIREVAIMVSNMSDEQIDLFVKYNNLGKVKLEQGMVCLTIKRNKDTGGDKVFFDKMD